MSVTFGGVEYEEVETGGPCEGCAFAPQDASRMHCNHTGDRDKPCCHDGRNVIFVRKEEG